MQVKSDTERECNRCHETKALEDFRKQPKGSLGRARVCKKCDQAYWKEQRSLDPRFRDWDRKGKVRRKYGEEGLAILARIDAGEGCEICGGRTTKMAVDHCHKTNVVRGLLCGKCNTAIGLLNENPELFASALHYLKMKASANASKK